MTKVLYTCGWIILGLFLFTTQVDAATVTQTIQREYVVSRDKVSVTETLKVKLNDSRFEIPAGNEKFLIFNPIPNDPDAQSKINKTLPTISVRNALGTAVNFATQTTGQNIEIIVPRSQIIRFGTEFVLTVTYDSYALLYQTGAIFDFYPPSFSKDFVFSDQNSELSISTRVKIPASLGEVNFTLPNKVATLVDGFWTYDFTHQELTGTVAWIQIGTKQFYQFELRQPVTGNSVIPFLQNKYSVLLPRDIVSGGLAQSVFFSEISPSPTSTYIDEEGNLVAEFFISEGTSEILVKGYASLVQDTSFDVKNSGGLSQLSAGNINKYTAAAEFWESTAPEIVSAAASLKTGEDIYSLVTGAYKFVIDRIDYSDVKRFGINERQGALKTLQGGAAVCMEYSDLFIALMRAQGVPARAAFGFGYDPRAGDTLDTAHQWAEVYLPAQDTWLSVDTTWGESGPEVIGANLNHFFHYVASTDPQTPAPVTAQLYGQGGEIQPSQFSITALPSIPSTDFQTQAEILEKFPKNESPYILQLILDYSKELVIGVLVISGLVIAYKLVRARRTPLQSTPTPHLSAHNTPRL